MMVRFEGLAATVDEDTENARFLPGCWLLGLSEYKHLGHTELPLLFNHWALMGRVLLSETKECERGLVVVGEIDSVTPLQERVQKEVLEGRLAGLSVGYKPIYQHLNPRPLERRPTERVIETALIREVSLVPNPRNDRARILKLTATEESGSGYASDGSGSDEG